jgi:hypothetical protein
LGALLRNLLLNWLVFLPLLSGLLLIPRIIESLLLWIEQNDPHSSLKALFKTFLWVPDSAGALTVGQLAGWAGLRSWVDTVAVVLIVIGFSVSAYNRPASGRSALKQAGFVKCVVVPVMVGAVLLTAAIASWANQMHGSWPELGCWVFFGAIVYGMARLIAAVCAFAVWAFARRNADRWRQKIGFFLLEFLGWLVAGMFTGLLIGLGAQHCAARWPAPLTDAAAYEIAKALAVFGPPAIVSCFLVGEAVYVGITSRLPSGERDREWLARAAG